MATSSDPIQAAFARGHGEAPRTGLRGTVRNLQATLNVITTELAEASEAASRCGIREGESLAEFIRRLHDEADDDE